ncbi:hypothetical protein SDC9_21402 [bioreactor metagenome]|uniref:Uncharacterized protein n=1 Tax=bioreactor metagenome TaxID=1076179 RepID=A0A644U9F1_9ZZZZ
MTDTTANLELPRILPAQAQKHVTHNEALQLLDAAVQLVVQGFDAVAPPETGSEGEVWALGAGPTGAWDGQAGKLAFRTETGWLFLTPRAGWRAWGRTEADLRIWHGDGWVSLFAGRAGLGINTGFDAVNRLSVAAAATLLNHEGAGHQLKINKAATGNTASLLFQSGWSGRAEMGLAGNDDFSVKVSADGASWVTGLTISAGGIAALPSGATIGGTRAYARGNVLGAVAQAAGVPTAALIERGSNANGEYVRFADGTQICTYSAVGAAGPIMTAEGAIWRSTEYSWTFPASFAATGNLAVNGSLRTGAAAWSKVRVTGISSASVMLFAANSNVNNFTVDFSAIGRWT